MELQNKHLGTHFRIFFDQAKGNWSDLAAKFAFARNTTINASTGLTPYEIVFGQKPQIPISLKLGLLRNSELTCNSEFCANLPLHRHSLQTSSNKAIQPLLKPKINTSLLIRENQFKYIYNTANKKSLENNAKIHKYRNKYKLGKPLEIGQKVLMENHSIEDGKSNKLQELRSGPYTVTNKVTNVNYEIKLDSDQTIKNTAHRNHLIEYFPIEEKAKELVNDYVLKDQSYKPFYENLMKSRNKNVNTPLTNKSFRNPMGSSEYLPVETHHRRENNIELHDTEQEKSLTNIDSGFQ